MIVQKLPIDDLVPKIRASLEAHPNLVLQASPGTGKTTRVPPALLQARFRRGTDEVLVLEPRRLAAKFSARRVAEEMGERVGATVGYQFRFENVGGINTHVRFLTEGMLMRRLLSSPNLAGCAAVILDEFHERHLHGDVALSYLRNLQQSARPDLRLIVMSATMEVAPVAAFLGGCPILHLETQMHPVKTEFLSSPEAKHLEQAVREAVSLTLAEPSGHILVFLPGMAEIRRVAGALTPMAAANGILITPLHGELSREEQDLAIMPTNQRKVILATNVAETSLTIDGVTTVIDSGLHRSASYSWWSGVPALRTKPISRASAIQRAGRAGRTMPGTCLRLYTRDDFNGRAPFETPEILRADLAQIVLELKSLGINDTTSFNWYERPATQALQSAEALLHRLGAISSSANGAKMTEIGRQMAKIPAHPRIARVMIEAERLGVLDDAATLCAMIQEGLMGSESGLDVMTHALAAAKDPLIAKSRTQLLAQFTKASRQPPSGMNSLDRLRFALLTGYPDRVTQKRLGAGKTGLQLGREVELVFSSGGSAKAENSGIIAHSEMFITLDLREQKSLGQTRSRMDVRSVCAIEPEWLFDLVPSAVEERNELEWDSNKKRVTAISRLTYDQLVLSESSGKPEDREAATRILLRSALGIKPEELPLLSAPEIFSALAPIAAPEACESFFARTGLLARYNHDSSVPDTDSAGIGNFILAAITSLTPDGFSLQDLQDMDLVTRLPEMLDAAVATKLARLLPEQITIGQNRRVRINYRLGQPPSIESRMQDFFGLEKSPTLMNGKLPLTIHLLAPNQRAVQITNDLAGFWRNAYPDIRKELCRRYPRHFWPENPLEAEPNRLVTRRRD